MDKSYEDIQCMKVKFYTSHCINELEQSEISQCKAGSNTTAGHYEMWRRTFLQKYGVEVDRRAILYPKTFPLSYRFKRLRFRFKNADEHSVRTCSNLVKLNEKTNAKAFGELFSFSLYREYPQKCYLYRILAGTAYLK